MLRTFTLIRHMISRRHQIGSPLIIYSASLAHFRCFTEISAGADIISALASLPSIAIKCISLIAYFATLLTSGKCAHFKFLYRYFHFKGYRICGFLIRVIVYSAIFFVMPSSFILLYEMPFDLTPHAKLPAYVKWVRESTILLRYCRLISPQRRLMLIIFHYGECSFSFLWLFIDDGHIFQSVGSCVVN